MSEEDQKFFGGMLLGAIIVGLILMTLIAFVLFQNAEDVGEFRVPVKKISQEIKELEAMPKLADKKRVGEVTQIEGSSYYVLQSLTNDEAGLVVRVLLKQTDRNEDFVNEAIIEKRLDVRCLNNDEVFAGQSHKINGPIYMSVWGKDGNELLNLDDEVIGKVADQPLVCALIDRWFDGDKIVMTSSRGDAGVINRTAYLYDPLTSELEQAASYTTLVQPFVSGEDESHNIDHVFHTWSQDGRAIQQLEEVVYLTGEQSNFSRLYYDDLSGEGLSFVEIANTMEIARTTNQRVVLDLISDYNLRHFLKGLEFNVNGDLVVTLWKKQ